MAFPYGVHEGLVVKGVAEAPTHWDEFWGHTETWRSSDEVDCKSPALMNYNILFSSVNMPWILIWVRCPEVLISGFHKLPPHSTVFFRNSNSFGVLSHSKGLGAEFFWLSRVLWGRSVLGCEKVPRKVPPRFRRGSTKVSRRLRKFRDLSGLLGQTPFVSERVLRRVPPSLLYMWLPFPSTLFCILPNQC